MIKKRGFTLSELLVTIVIMASLAAIAMPLYNKTIKRSRAADALNVLSMISAKQEAYFVSNGIYATSFTQLAAPIEGLVGDKEVTVGSFKYTLTGLCVTASRQEDGYQISKNMKTQQEGCKNMDASKACEMLSSLIPTQDASDCVYVPSNKPGEDLPPDINPCKINPAACCAGVYDNGICNECKPGTIWSVTLKKCVCNIRCLDGVSKVNPTTCKCDCDDTPCLGGGQVKNEQCACACPPELPEWDTEKQACTNKCTAPKTRWAGTKCVCPLDKPLEIDGDCIACNPPRLVTSGAKCDCPPELPNFWKDNNTCRACKAGELDTHKAACEYSGKEAKGPAGSFDVNKCLCSCPKDATLTELGGSCACGKVAPFFHSGKCNMCPFGKEMTINNQTKNICCLPNQVTLDGANCRYQLEPQNLTINVMGTISASDHTVTSRAFYLGGNLATENTKKYGETCCSWCDGLWGGMRTVKKYYTGCAPHPTGSWSGGRLLTTVSPICPPGSDQEICDKNCSADGKACAFLCVKGNINMPTNAESRKYECYTPHNKCKDGWRFDTTYMYPSHISGTATVLQCCYKGGSCPYRN